MTTLALTGGTVLAGAGLESLPDACVVISDGSITEIGPAESLRIPPDAERVDAKGLTLVPGFIDAHVHIGFYSPHSVVVAGVTTARDLGWPPEVIFPLVRASREAAFDGPSLLAAGAMLTAPGGYPTRARWAPPGTGWEIDGPEAARQAVAALTGAGASVVKIALNPPVGPTLDASTVEAVVEAAHAAGLKVTSHTHGLDELDKALHAGVDELAHMLMGEEPIPSPMVEEMVQRNMTVVPTLAIRSGRELDVAVRNLAAFLEAGGRIVYGTDLGNAGPRPGIDHNEVSLMAAAGMSSRAIIASATTAAASWLNLASTGVLEPGRDADLVAVPGDPLADLRALVKPRFVCRRGRRFA